MKKLILLAMILNAATISAQMGGLGGGNEPFILEEDPFGKSPLYNNEPIPIHRPKDLKEFYTAGVTLGGGLGFGCAFDVSIYVANGLNQLISFGYSASLRSSSEKLEVRTRKIRLN